MQKLVILTGPTAVGKTKLSIELAKAIGGEIISADSMQVYKKMDIGTAKIMPNEMDGIKHHLIDVLEPNEEFNVVLFQEMAKNAINQIYDRGHIPIICGGTGFYIQSIIKDIDFKEVHEDKEYRLYLQDFAKKNGNDALFEMLRQVDPESCENIDKNNVKRVIRAIEYFHITGQKISVHNKEQAAKKSPYNYAYFVLTDNRKTLYERIDQRVDIMLQNGLVKEVEDLYKDGLNKGATSMEAIGYKEIDEYLNGNITLDEATTLIKQNSRHLAKRQLTWFRREDDVIWLDKSLNSEDKILTLMLDKLKEKQIYN